MSHHAALAGRKIASLSHLQCPLHLRNYSLPQRGAAWLCSPVKPLASCHVEALAKLMSEALIHLCRCSGLPPRRCPQATAPGLLLWRSSLQRCRCEDRPSLLQPACEPASCKHYFRTSTGALKAWCSVGCQHRKAPSHRKNTRSLRDEMGKVCQPLPAECYLSLSTAPRAGSVQGKNQGGCAHRSAIQLWRTLGAAARSTCRCGQSSPFWQPPLMWNLHT